MRALCHQTKYSEMILSKVKLNARGCGQFREFGNVEPTLVLTKLA